LFLSVLSFFKLLFPFWNPPSLSHVDFVEALREVYPVLFFLPSLFLFLQNSFFCPLSHGPIIFFFRIFTGLMPDSGRSVGQVLFAFSQVCGPHFSFLMPTLRYGRFFFFNRLRGLLSGRRFFFSGLRPDRAIPVPTFFLSPSFARFRAF